MCSLSDLRKNVVTIEHYGHRGEEYIKVTIERYTVDESGMRDEFDEYYELWLVLGQPFDTEEYYCYGCDQYFVFWMDADLHIEDGSQSGGDDGYGDWMVGKASSRGWE